MAGRPCWLKACKNEGSTQSAAPDVGQDPAGTPKRAANKHPTSRTVVHQISVQDPVLIHRPPTVSNIYNQNHQQSLGGVESRESVAVRFKMVLDKYQTSNVHNEYEESFMMVHLDSIGIMAGLSGAMFMMFLIYKLCKSKGVRRYANICCNHCCESNGLNDRGRGRGDKHL